MSHSYSAIQCPEIMDIFVSREGEFNRDIITKLKTTYPINVELLVLFWLIHVISNFDFKSACNSN